MIWKLLAINLLGFVLTTFISSHLRASLNRPSPDYDNQLTYLCTKNSACFLYQLVWVVVVAVSQIRVKIISVGFIQRKHRLTV